MMDASFDDKRASHRAVAKYFLPFVIGFFILCLTGQLIGEFIPVSQLNKASGSITDLETKVTSHTHQRGTNSYVPNYSLVITLNNRQQYNVEDLKTQARLKLVLHTGNYVTIYYPTLLLKVLNAGFVHQINQVELNNQVVYSFDEQKKENWALAGFFTVAAGALFALRQLWMNG